MFKYAHPRMPRLLVAASLALGLSLGPGLTTARAQAPLPQVEGEIRKIDTDTGKLTIRHGDIPNLEMPAMTMVFKAAPDLLARARIGEKILFTADRVQGALTVTSLQERP